MIIFVDMRSAKIFGYRFALWDNVLGAFLQMNGGQAWDTVAEMVDDAEQDTNMPDIDRLKRLCPEWAAKEARR